jgi:2-polyprenyl-3-methyl-5-hydroxy-6-metoxy-1,4-benzoquinol methylase
MMINTKQRSTAPEIMDDFSMEGEILTDALDKIAAINKLLGGNKVTLEGVNYLIAKGKLDNNIKIIDVGCGNGAMLRMLAHYGLKKGLAFELIGIDANKATIAHAESLSTSYPNIKYQCSDIFSNDGQTESCDIMLFTLTLHHFTDQQIITLFQKLKDVVQSGIVVNDLHRSALAYRLFTALSYVFKLNNMSREDGLVSILRGFKRNDILAYEKQLSISSAYIKWKWAFRYLWIIRTK